MKTEIGSGCFFVLGKKPDVWRMPRHNQVTMLRLFELLSRKPRVSYDDLMCIAWGHETGDLTRQVFGTEEAIARDWILYCVRYKWLVPA